MTFWLNGKFREDETAIHIADRGFLLGDGVFETLLVDCGAPAFLDEHISRLRAGLAALRIKADVPVELASIIQNLAARNGLSDCIASARLTVSRGVCDRGLAIAPGDAASPNVLLTLAPAIASAPQDAPARLMISRIARPEASPCARHKTLNYLDNLLALNEARESGADEAVMANSKGRAACASCANIFVISEDGVSTPLVAEGALPGVVREQLLASARETGVAIAECEISIDELRRRALFLTNSLIGLRAARLIDGDEPDTAQTEIFKTLATWYQRRLRENLTKRSTAS